MGYYDNINRELYSLVPKNLSKVLELGCGAGTLGGLYKSNHEKCCWTGIELVPEQARLAEAHIDRVINVDLEAIWPLSIDDEFDALVIGDVLEHLKDPWGILNKLVSHIKTDGHVVVCIPNVSHWTVVHQLLHGLFLYADSGVLDKTHLRFFTLNTMITMLQEAGLEIKVIIPRLIPANPAMYDRYINAMKAYAAEFNLDIDKMALNSQAMQYVIYSKRKIS